MDQNQPAQPPAGGEDYNVQSPQTALSPVLPLEPVTLKEEGRQKPVGPLGAKIIGLVIIIFILAGIIFWVRGRNTPKKDEMPAVPTPQEVLPTVDPSVEISLTPRLDNHAVILKISKLPANTISIDYELTYETASGLPRGVLGKIEVKGEDTIEREILLGTCSRNKCVYDEGVKKVSLVLKFNTSSGSSQFQKEYPL